jgi:hypothetical protein
MTDSRNDHQFEAYVKLMSYQPSWPGLGLWLKMGDEV